MNANHPNDFQTPPGGPAPYGTLPGEAPPDDSHRYFEVRFPQRRPYVTYAIIGVTVLVFILQLVSNAVLKGDYPAALGAKINQYIVDYGEYWRFLTPVLLHSTGNLLHIAGNMYGLYIFGPNLERFYGHYRFLGLYVLAGFTGNVLSFVFSPNPSIGASTAIFGLLVAEGIFIYRNRFLHGGDVRSMLVNILILVVLNLALGLSPGIDNWGHLGGLLGGAAFAWWAGPKFKLEGLPPAFHLADARPKWVQWLTLGAVFAAFSVLAAWVILSRS